MIVINMLVLILSWDVDFRFINYDPWCDFSLPVPTVVSYVQVMMFIHIGFLPLSRSDKYVINAL